MIINQCPPKKASAIIINSVKKKRRDTGGGLHKEKLKTPANIGTSRRTAAAKKTKDNPEKNRDPASIHPPCLEKLNRVQGKRGGKKGG